MNHSVLWAKLRAHMVLSQIADRGLTDPDLQHAMGAVPRHLFVPEQHRALAYADHPLPIGHDQTISQPYIVALMTHLAALKPGDKVLEIGTGCGYQTAVLASMGAEVYSIEIVAPLAEEATARLQELGYTQVHIRAGDGYTGWPSEAPFDAILVAAAPERIPAPLLEQLAPGGRLIIPVGQIVQELKVFTRTEEGVKSHTILPVRFVPMTGRAEETSSRP